MRLLKHHSLAESRGRCLFCNDNWYEEYDFGPVQPVPTRHQMPVVIADLLGLGLDSLQLETPQYATDHGSSSGRNAGAPAAARRQNTAATVEHYREPVYPSGGIVVPFKGMPKLSSPRAMYLRFRIPHFTLHGDFGRHLRAHIRGMIKTTSAGRGWILSRCIDWHPSSYETRWYADVQVFDRAQYIELRTALCQWSVPKPPNQRGKTRAKPKLQRLRFESAGPFWPYDAITITLDRLGRDADPFEAARQFAEWMDALGSSQWREYLKEVELGPDDSASGAPAAVQGGSGVRRDAATADWCRCRRYRAAAVGTHNDRGHF